MSNNLSSFSKTDPRILARINKVFSFITDNFAINEEVEMSSEDFESALGEHDLAKTLKSILFICTDESYIAACFKNNNGKKAHPKKWKLNPEGIITVSEYFNIGQPPIALTIVERLSRRYQDELESGEFSYNEKTHRHYHYLTSVKKDIRSEILMNFDFVYEYDIQSAAPTILYYEYLKITNKRLTVLEKYINDPKTFRMIIAKETNTSYEKVKQLLTAMNYNAKLTSAKVIKKGEKFEISACFEIAETEEVLKAWCENQSLRELSRSFHKVYKVIKTHFGYKTPREVSIFYMEIEERIRDILMIFCIENKIKKFTIHDAIITNQKIDFQVISDKIEKELGYKVLFTTKILGEE
jgi:hypothetical protein